MATIQTIDATIFASSHPDIAKRTSVSGVLISSVMLLVGILAFASTFELKISLLRLVWLCGSGNRFIPYGDFPSLLEIKRSYLFANQKCG